MVCKPPAGGCRVQNRYGGSGARRWNGENLSHSDGEYGLYVLTVDGETADESIQQWWCITKGGEEHFYGVDDTMIQDGEQYEFTLKTGW